jgi:hypothetical protein
LRLLAFFFLFTCVADFFLLKRRFLNSAQLLYIKKVCVDIFLAQRSAKERNKSAENSRKFNIRGVLAPNWWQKAICDNVALRNFVTSMTGAD